jgi:hypothetical protein
VSLGKSLLDAAAAWVGVLIVATGAAVLAGVTVGVFLKVAIWMVQ